VVVLSLLAAAAGCRPFPGWFRPAQESREVTFRIEYTFTATGRTPWVRVMALVPKTIPGRQTVHDVQFSLPPLRVYDLEDRRYAEFFFSGVVREFTVSIAGTARLLRYDLATACRLGRPAPLPDPRPYLLDEPSIEVSHPAVVRAAEGIHGTDELDTLRKLYDFVLRRMEFGGTDLSPAGGGAAKALQSGKGDCTEYSDLLVALCRAKGIPARPVLGLLCVPGNDVPQHSWVEVHTAACGWVPFDPVVDDCSDNASFERLGPNYLAFSTVRNDPLLENYHAFAIYRWWGDRLTLREKYDIRPVTQDPTSRAIAPASAGKGP
jgi:transglutaminase-like putative cysteine protease